jgi:hypothetical protein
MDPMRWWHDWLAAATRAATEAGRASFSAPPNPFAPPSAPPNPFAGMFANPFASAAPNAMPNPAELWRRWLEALPLLALNPTAAFGAMFGAMPGAEPSQPSGSGTNWLDPFGLAARWRELLAAGGAPDASAGAIPGDPWTVFRQWYERASAAMSPPLEEWLRSDVFAQAAGAFWENASTATSAARRAAEAQMAALGMASRQDVARVAGLVVQVEAKVDGIAEALEAAQDAQDANATEAMARADTLAALERRVERIEAKLDRLLAALEPPAQHGRADPRRADPRRADPAPAERTRAASTRAASTRAAPTSPPSAPASGNGNGASTPPARAHKPSTTRGRRKPPSGP